MGMVVRVARDLPLAILGMVVTITATQKLLELSDAMSHAVLRGGGDDAKEVLRVLTALLEGVALGTLRYQPLAPATLRACSAPVV